MGGVVLNVLNTKAGAVGVAVLLGGGLLYYFAKKSAEKVGAALTAVGERVDPTSDKNLAYSGINAIGAAVSGDGAWTLGGAIYDIFHPSDLNQRVFSSTEPARPEDKPSSLR